MWSAPSICSTRSIRAIAWGPGIQAGLDRGVEPAAIRDAARLLQSYELMYWDALLAATSLGTATGRRG